MYAYVFKLNLHKQNRDTSLVNQEYNLGLWARNVEDSELTSTVGNFGKTGQDGIFAVSNELVKLSYDDFEKNSQKELISFLHDFEKNEIIELGCGMGGNLFSLYNSGFQNLSGCDISPNAIIKLKNYNDRNNTKIDFFVHDLNKPFKTNLIKDKVVFTKSVLEQTKNTMQTVLRNILDGEPKIVIHFEVDYDSEPLLVRKYFDSRGYQNNLVSELKKLESEEKISLVKIQKFKFSGTPVNRLSAIIWKPKQ